MKSFVDLLFILLCSTIVMLSRSIEVGSVEIRPAEVGAGGVSEVLADDVQVAAVTNQAIKLEDDNGAVREFGSIAALEAVVGKNKCILLSSANEKVTHHRIMRVWSQLVEAGYTVKLAAAENKKREAGSEKRVDEYLNSNI